MTGMFTLQDTGTLMREILGRMGEGRISYHGEGQLRVSVMTDPYGIAIRRAPSSDRSQPFVTLRGFADTC